LNKVSGHGQCRNARKLTMKFKQYDVVRLMGVHVPMRALVDESNLRQPVAGDVATIIEIYSQPAGYELECSDCNGITQWLMAFGPDEIELELAK
jgi:hypothetical protein